MRVEVARPGAHLRYRKSYRMRSPDEELADRLLAHLLYGGGENALGAKITWEEATAGAAGGAARRSSAVRITVPLRELTFLEKEPGGEERGGVFSVALVERDATGRTSAVRRATIPVSASRGDVAQKSFTYEVAMSLAEGDHEIAVAVRDDLSGRVGLTKQTVRSRGSIASTGSGL